jgi:hypothetical protein
VVTFAIRARIQEAEERATARVIQGDLAMAAGRLKEMTEDQRWFPFYTFTLPHWAQGEALLARSLASAANAQGRGWR